jgi:glucoamylase
MRLLRLVVLLALLTPAGASAATAPGAPGERALWAAADKDGYGTAHSTQSKVWHTLNGGELTEVYYPTLDTPAFRDLQFVVSDGRTFAERETDAANHTISLADPRSLTYRQVTSTPRYRIAKTYVTDPARNSLMIDVRFTSRTGKKLALYALGDPALSNNGNDDSGSTAGRALLAHDASAGEALIAKPRFKRTSVGYLGTSDGWTDLRSDFRMDGRYSSAPNGNVVQTGRTKLDGVRKRHLTLVLGFGPNAAAARSTARASLQRGFARTAGRYEDGWHRYLGSVNRRPASARDYATTYDVSVMTLAAHEDKTFRGAYVASPSMPWVWGQGLSDPSDAYHLVWSRDLYQIATALLAAGDRGGAERASAYLFERQQKAEDGCFPQNSTVDGTPKWGNLQLDEVAFPIVLAWQLGRRDSATYAHVKRAVGCILANGPQTPQERWENQGGYSPATIASEIAGLVTAADLARANGDGASATAWEATADDWQSKVDGWTATGNGPYSSKPYYLRLTKDGNPDAGTAYDLGDSGPAGVDQRKITDPSYLELVRLGVKPATSPIIRNTLGVVDQRLGVNTPNGQFWHRYDFDGYGEKKDGSNWDIGQPVNPTEDWANNATIGRIWPIFAGERGEYELADGNRSAARGRLASIAAAAGPGHMIAEQVWDQFPPSGSAGFPRGTSTLSASPLAWSHAQFVRLAWSIDAGRPVEQPRIVAKRYTRWGTTAAGRG